MNEPGEAVDRASKPRHEATAKAERVQGSPLGSDLREQVARRLRAAFTSTPPGPDADGEPTSWGEMVPGDECFERNLLMSDEVIRCMEWARRCVSTSGPMTEEREDQPGWVKILKPHEIHLGDLTLPPEDWKP
jgi:hypothetical protein